MPSSDFSVFVSPWLVMVVATTGDTDHKEADLTGSDLCVCVAGWCWARGAAGAAAETGEAGEHLIAHVVHERRAPGAYEERMDACMDRCLHG
jgi:hypothetical protein